MPPKYQVICLDGETRHSGRFATLTAALRWTAEGHDRAPVTVHDLVVLGESGRARDHGLHPAAGGLRSGRGRVPAGRLAPSAVQGPLLMHRESEK